MADDKSKRGKPDRSKVAGGEKYEVNYVAKKLAVSPGVVRRAIDDVGKKRADVENEVRRIKKAWDR